MNDLPLMISFVHFRAYGCISLVGRFLGMIPGVYGVGLLAWCMMEASCRAIYMYSWNCRLYRRHVLHGCMAHAARHLHLLTSVWCSPRIVGVVVGSTGTLIAGNIHIPKAMI